MLARRRSSRLEEERQAVEQQVEEAFRQHSDGSGTKLIRRRSSAYLPPNLPPTGDNLRVAKHIIQDVYSLQEMYERQHFIENAACCIAMVGVMLVILDNEYIVSTKSKLVLRVANAVLTAFLLGLICWRFVLQCRILIRRNVLPPGVRIFRMPKQLMKLASELAVCSIFVPPGTNGSFNVHEWKFNVEDGPCGAPFVAREGSCYLEYSYPFEVLGLLALLRLYMIPRVLRNLSSFASYHTSYLGALHRVDTMTPLFAIKCFLQSHPFWLLLAAFLGALTLTSYALTIVETPVNPSLASLSNSMWLVALTMATVGYGDIVPITTAGQVLLVIGGMTTGILLVAALSAALFSLLWLDERDKHFIHLLRVQQYERELKHACARTIQISWKRFLAFNIGVRARQKLCDSLYKHTSIQRKLRKKSEGDYISVGSAIHQCRESLLASLRREQLSTLIRLQRVENRLDLLVAAAATKLNKDN